MSTEAPDSLAVPADRVFTRREGVAARRTRVASVAERARVVEALRGLAPGDDGRDRLIHRLAAGKQAVLFTVRAADEQPVWEKHSELVVKLYLSDGPRERAALRDELESLHRLHARLNGISIRGWRVRCPLPIHQSEHPLALVMTAVPGDPINSLLGGRRRPDPDVLNSLADASIDALEKYWAGDLRPYGDPNLKNILFDQETRTLSFVDPGLPEEVYRCDDAPGRWYPASRDIAFLLYWTAVTVKSSLGRPHFQRRREQFAARMLEAALAKLGSSIERHSFLGEIEACTRVHLDRILLSRSPAGMWRRFVKALAARTIRAIIDGQRGGNVDPVTIEFRVSAAEGAAAPAARFASESKRASA